jgi:chorismate synthase
MSDGSDLIFRAAVKPTPSISRPQDTVDIHGENRTIEIRGRHDPVIVPRAVVVVESMAAITLVDALFTNMSATMNGILEFYQKRK